MQYPHIQIHLSKRVITSVLTFDAASKKYNPNIFKIVFPFGILFGFSPKEDFPIELSPLFSSL
jgi:hypothetical protein